ncbi:hypothetical protein [Clostridium estertheticum]|uniref:hypothetical protein n=1 Tax=Clostridium estertheticum TaxID=238834 RepID=UPI001C7DCA3A|nr:hypothetical protein [Clostridium estertheticum]MBX4272096.1 hypothetical protein [Clostridium estertheticum]WLC78901.1 hypothetical protein KTC98_17150 [Clostridium estertheticum]
MGFSYLNNNNWANITREERVFCSDLFHTIQGNEKKFIRWLKNKEWLDNKKLIFIDVELEEEWEIAYEVCFYRDYFSVIKNMGVGSSDFSPKRTFDLCLFSEKRIIIIEAKVQQPFEYRDIIKYTNDKTAIQRLIGTGVEVELVALASSIYFINHKRFGKQSTLSAFDGLLAWKELYEYFGNKRFDLADKMYNT